MPQLTAYEVKFCRLIIEGCSNRQIAGRLDIALRTAELHRQKLMRKLGAKSAGQLGYLIAQHPAFQPEPAL